MAKYAIGTLAVFICGVVWLLWSWNEGNKSYSWTPVTATVTKLDAERTHRRKIATSYLTTIEYSFGDNQYEAVLREYMLGPQVTVYVNPDDPRQVVAVQGATVYLLAYPIALTVTSGLFAIVLGLIVLSPKDD